MDGSLAAISGRMRSQLQRAYSVSADTPDQSLFEELLKVPVRSSSNEDLSAVSQFERGCSAPCSTGDKSEEAKSAVSEKPDAGDDEPEEDATIETADPNSAVPFLTAPIVALESPDAAATDLDLNATSDDRVLSESAVACEGCTQTEQPSEAPLLVNATTKLPEARPTTDEGTLEIGNVDEGEGLPEAKQTKRTSKQNEKSTDDLAAPSQIKPVTTASRNPLDKKAEVKDAHSLNETRRSSGDESGVPHPVALAENTGEVDRATSGDRSEKWYLNDGGSPNAAATSADDHAKDEESTEAQSSLLDAVRESGATSSSPGLADALAGITELAQSASETAASDLAAIAAVQAATGQTSGSLSGSSTNSPSESLGGRTTLSSIESTTSSSTGSGSATASNATGDKTKASEAVAGKDKDLQQLSQQERVRLVQRVARSFSRLGPEGGQITLKLHPPQLGVLNLSVRIEGQTMTARLKTESSAARDAILENLPVLRERLAEQGVEIERFQVDIANGSDLSSSGQSLSQNTSGSEAGQQSESGRGSIDYRRLSRSTAASAGVGSSVDSRSSWSIPNGVDRSLDVRA